MENTSIRLAQMPQDIVVIMNLAEQTWAPTYQHILPAAQLAYMYRVIYSAAALQAQMSAGQTFLLLYQYQTPAGFAAYSPLLEPGIFKLNKLYVAPIFHGQGYGKLLIYIVQEKVKAAGGHTLQLNVNRQNPAQKFYEKHGFAVTRPEDVPIGPYWMEDYVMQKNLTI